METEGLVSDFDKSDAVSDGEELKKATDAMISEIEYNIFTETEDESKTKSKIVSHSHDPIKRVPTRTSKAELFEASPYYNVNLIKN